MTRLFRRFSHAVYAAAFYAYPVASAQIADVVLSYGLGGAVFKAHGDTESFIGAARPSLDLVARDRSAHAAEDGCGRPAAAAANLVAEQAAGDAAYNGAGDIVAVTLPDNLNPVHDALTVHRRIVRARLLLRTAGQ